MSTTNESVELYISKRLARESKKPYKVLVIKVADFDKLVFLSSFEIKYLESILGEAVDETKPF